MTIDKERYKMIHIEDHFTDLDIDRPYMQIVCLFYTNGKTSNEKELHFALNLN